MTTRPFQYKPVVMRDLSPLISRKLSALLLSAAYKQTFFCVITSLICASLAVFSVWNTASFHELGFWSAGILAMIVLRLVSFYFYKRQEFPEQATTVWHGLFVLYAVLEGLLWGAAACYLMTQGLGASLVLGVCVLFSVTLAGIHNLSMFRLAAWLFVLGIFIPLSFVLSPIELSAQAILLALVCIVISRTHFNLKQAVFLQFENNKLATEQAKVAKQLQFINSEFEQMVTHDALTNLANRTFFIDNFSRALISAERHKKMLALLSLDLDQFKTVNDYHGYPMGDQLLLAVAHRLESVCQRSDIISRVGGDEFTVLLENVTSLQEIEKLARHICEALSLPIHIGTVELAISVSLGVSIYPIDSIDAEELLNMADRAMAHVKSLGGNNYHFRVEMVAE